MTLQELLSELSERGVQLWAIGDQLRIRAPRNVLTPELYKLLAEHKDEFLSRLRRVNGDTSSISLPKIIPALEQRYEPFPLNDIQQAYWVGRQGIIESGNIAAHVYMEIDSNHLDIHRLSTAWQQLIERHEMLRAIVLPSGEQQILERVPPYKIEVLDLRGMKPEAVTARLKGVYDELSHQILSLNNWPLFEIRITRISEKHFRIHLSIDLLIVDFGSILLLVKEWSQLYQNSAASLPPLEVSYRDYVLTEKLLVSNELYLRSRDYWFSRLDSLYPKPQLPLAQNPLSIKKPQFKRRSFQLNSESWQQLKERAEKAGLTPSGVLLAAFAEVLTVWSQHPQFTINLTQYKRLPLHPQVHDIVGNTTSIILLTVDNSVADSFVARARRLQQQLWQDLDHLHISGVSVLRELVRRRGQMQSAIMPIVFTSLLGLDALGKGALLPEFGEVVHMITQTPQVWLDHQVMEQKEALITNWDAMEDLFPAGLLDDMFESYQGLLTQLATSESVWLETFRQLVPTAQLAQRAILNASSMPISDQMLHTLFTAQIEARAQEPAVISSHRTMTYQELYEESNRLGHRLRQLGASPNTLVAIVMEKDWEQVVAVLGILASGAAYLPVDPELPAERREHLLKRGEVKLVLTQSHLNEKLEWPENIQRICVDGQDLVSIDPRPLEPVQRPDDLAYVLYTSGSTGFPKGVMLDHRGPVNTVTDINRRFGIGPGDRVLALSALSFDLSVYDVFGILAAGGTIVLPEHARFKDPSHWVELMTQHRVTLWNSVPTLMQMLVEHLSGASEKAPPFLRLVLMSGDWIPASLPNRIKALWDNIRMISLGGATEASIWSILYPIEEVDPDWKKIPYGKPMKNQSFQVLNEALEPRPNWVPGQLYIGGIGLAKGYWRDETTTNTKFIIHPQTKKRLYQTGDLGSYLPDGNIEILGRDDFQIKIGGYRIELGEIESTLRSHPSVRDAVVTAVERQGGNKSLMAYVVSEKELRSDKQEGIIHPQAAESNRFKGWDRWVSRLGVLAKDWRLLLRRARHHPIQFLANLVGSHQVLLDPVERIEFKLRQKGLRSQVPGQTGIQLCQPNHREALAQIYLKRKTTREFLDAPIPLEQFSLFLSCLRQMKLDDAPLPKYRYPSAGSLYPVQTYLHIKHNRVEGINGGTYYYNPAGHRLELIAPAAEIEAKVHVDHNRPVFEQASFSLFLIGQLNAITPIYGKSLGKELAMLEAGYMGQLIMTNAAETKIGLCPIGALDFDSLRKIFSLEASHVYLHSFIGGTPKTAEVKSEIESKTTLTPDSLIAELQTYLEKKLPAYMIPSTYMLLEAMPLTSNGKLDRKALPPPEDLQKKPDVVFVSPQTEIEQRLTRIVEETLKIQGVGINTSFFDLGANSIRLVQMHRKIETTLAREISIIEMFRHPTISFLAKYLNDEQAEKPSFDEEADRAKKRREDLKQLRQVRVNRRGI